MTRHAALYGLLLCLSGCGAGMPHQDCELATVLRLSVPVPEGYRLTTSETRCVLSDERARGTPSITVLLLPVGEHAARRILAQPDGGRRWLRENVALAPGVRNDERPVQGRLAGRRVTAYGFRGWIEGVGRRHVLVLTLDVGDGGILLVTLQTLPEDDVHRRTLLNLLPQVRWSR